MRHFPVSLPRVLAATMMVGAALLVSQPAMASQGCGEYSYGFAGTRLLNDGISMSAGPFAIDLPAGTYDVELHSHDAHSEHPGQIEQTEEQWYVELDSGWVSGLSNDIPLEADWSFTMFTSQTIPASTAITVRHRGVGSVNSVNPICVGFTPVEAPAAAEEEVAPVVAGPVTPEPQPVVDPESEPEAVAPPTQVDVVAPGEEAPVPVEVEGKVEQPAPAAPEAQLALTGPQDVAVAGIGVGLIVLGGMMLAFERRLLGR